MAREGKQKGFWPLAFVFGLFVLFLSGLSWRLIGVAVLLLAAFRQRCNVIKSSKILSLFWVWMNYQKKINVLYQERVKFNAFYHNHSSWLKYLPVLLENTYHSKTLLKHSKEFWRVSMMIYLSKRFI